MDATHDEGTKRMAKLPLVDLLEEVLDLAQGDLWDGMFSKAAWRRYHRLRAQLEERIAALEETE